MDCRNDKYAAIKCIEDAVNMAQSANNLRKKVNEF